LGIRHDAKCIQQNKDSQTGNHLFHLYMFFDFIPFSNKIFPD
jgi:hypothetical protein